MDRPASTRIQAVIFDVGNVQCRLHQDRMLRNLAAVTGRPADAVQALLYGEGGLLAPYEDGHLDSAGFLAALSAFAGRPLPEEATAAAFTDMFSPIPETLDLLRRLKPGHRLGLLSNTSPWHAERYIRHLPGFPLFDAVTYSFEVGAPKPDPRIFEDALRKLDLPPGACAYIDDIPAFAQAATACGLQGLTYTTPAALEADLARLGVVP